MKTLVTVLTTDAKAKKYETGQITKWAMCQCIVHKVQEGGEIRQEVGVLRVPEALCPVPAQSSALESLPDVPPGDYLAEYGLNIDWKTKELEGRLIGLTRRAPEVKPAVKDQPKA